VPGAGMSTYREILAMFEKLQTELDEAREREAMEVAEKVRQVLADSGIDLEVLLGARKVGRQRGVRVRPKYWNPETRQTWSGRGRTPLWLAGKNPEDYRIKDDQ